MGRNWREYNEELVKRGEILIDPSNFSPKEEKAKKRGRSYTYPRGVIEEKQVILWSRVI